MPDEPTPSGGLTLPDSDEGHTTSSANSLQINISLAQPTADPTSIANGVWIRRIFIDPQNAKKVETSYIPYDPEHKDSTEVRNPDPGEKASWKKILGDTIADIDLGTSIVWLASDEQSGVAIWLPDDHTQKMTTFYFTGEAPDGEPAIGLKEFRKCMKAQKKKKGSNYAIAFCECANQL
jgi:hypothetical protein